MSLKSTISAALAATFILASAAFGDIASHRDVRVAVSESYARAATPTAKAGAIFMQLFNLTGQDDTLIEVRSDVAKRVELHTHIDQGNGVMQMTKIEGGIALPDRSMHRLKRGGDHVMLMGLNRSLIQGDMVTLTLVFEHAGEVVIEVPVDNERKATHGEMKHSN